jgi:hypothetical protein
MAERGYGVFLFLGLMLGVGLGIAAGEPSLGAVVGIGSGALLALLLRVLRRQASLRPTQTTRPRRDRAAGSQSGKDG